MIEKVQNSEVLFLKVTSAKNDNFWKYSLWNTNWDLFYSKFMSRSWDAQFFLYF